MRRSASLAERRTGRFLGWDFRPGYQIHSLGWSGIRTRDSRYLKPMLYPSELSRGDVPDSNQRSRREPILSLSVNVIAKHLFPASGIRHGSAARTGRACEPVPLETVRSVLRIGVAKRQSVCAAAPARPPVPGIRAQRFMPSKTAAPHSGTSLSAGSLPGCQDADAATRKHSTPLRTRKKNAPGFGPRAFAFLGDRGDRSP